MPIKAFADGRIFTVTHPWVEPLYVDQERLDTYYSQVVTVPRTRRVPTYNMTVGLNPSINLQGSVQPVPVSLGDKLATLTDHLTAQGQLRSNRPAHFDRWDLGEPAPSTSASEWQEMRAVFRREVCEVRTLRVPPTEDLKNGLSLWVSNGPSLLYLVENYPFADRPLHLVSGFTLLMMLSDLEVMPLSRMFGDSASPLEGETTVEAELMSVLSDLGGTVGPAKMVDVLYRVRGTFAEQKLNFRTSVVGYPIVMIRA